MARTNARGAAMQIGEFAVGTALAYVAVGAAWAATAAVWAPLLVAAAVVAGAVGMEIRVRPKGTGPVVGPPPTPGVTPRAVAAPAVVPPPPSSLGGVFLLLGGGP